MAKRGPKLIELDWKQFDKLCSLQCTLREIANYFECSEDTIETRVKEAHGIKFSEYYDKKRSAGKISIRRLQFAVAESGNVTMLIWLGKQYLGQKDQVEQINHQIISGDSSVLNGLTEQQISEKLLAKLKSK